MHFLMELGLAAVLLVLFYSVAGLGSILYERWQRRRVGKWTKEQVEEYNNRSDYNDRWWD
jgi:hypothetical protein